MHNDDEKVAVNDKLEETRNNSIELIRKCKETLNASWENSFNASSLNVQNQSKFEKTPPFVSILITDDLSPGEGRLANSSTEPFVTLPDCNVSDVSLAFSKDYNMLESTSTETSEHCLGKDNSLSLRDKRKRRDFSDHDEKNIRPWKKNCTATESNTSSTSDLTEEDLKKWKKEIQQKQAQLEEENTKMKEALAKMMVKIQELDGKLSNSNQQAQPKPYCQPPPPPPPPPPSAPKVGVSRSNTITRCGSAPSRIAGPSLTITPQDIANVKLRKAEDNPVRTKSATNGQPWGTQQMIQTTRAKLGRARPVATSSPKQQLTELQKCLLFRRCAVRNTLSSAEELRALP